MYGAVEGCLKWELMAVTCRVLSGWAVDDDGEGVTVAVAVPAKGPLTLLVRFSDISSSSQDDRGELQGNNTEGTDHSNCRQSLEFFLSYALQQLSQFRSEAGQCPQIVVKCTPFPPHVIAHQSRIS